MNNVLELYLIAKLATLLTQEWKDTEAYKLGILDAKGKVLKKSYQLKTAKEKTAYSSFHRFAFNLRRLIESLPGGKTKLAKYLALWTLFKEETLNPLDAVFMENFPDINTDFQQYIAEESGQDEGIQTD